VPVAKVPLSRLSLFLVFLGATLVVNGVRLIYYEGVKVYYWSDVVNIPVYHFETDWPGNYSKEADLSFVVACTRWSYVWPANDIKCPEIDFAEPKSFITPVTSTYWRTSCKGGDTLSLYMRGWKTIDPNATPYVRVELKGCSDSECETLLSEEVVMENVDWDLAYKREFKLNKSIFGYKYLNFTLVPRERTVAIHEFSAFTNVHCVFNYSLTQPTVWFSSVKVYPYVLHYPQGVDYSGLVNGLTFSLTGLLLMLIGIYMKLHDIGRQLVRGAAR
jgi:hypothetical protein